MNREDGLKEQTSKERGGKYQEKLIGEEKWQNIITCAYK